MNEAVSIKSDAAVATAAFVPALVAGADPVKAVSDPIAVADAKVDSAVQAGKPSPEAPVDASTARDKSEPKADAAQGTTATDSPKTESSTKEAPTKVTPSVSAAKPPSNGKSAADKPSVESTSAPAPPPPAPKISAAEQAAFWRPSRGMQGYHNSHKHTFNRSYERADCYQKHGQSLKTYLRESYNLVIHLGNHHAIEEAYIFPLLAHKHPAFRNNAEHKESHAFIHNALDRYSNYINAAMKDEKKYDPKEMREILDSFRDVLMHHLDQEVRDLEPDSLRAHGFTLAEVRRLPF